MFEYAVVGSGIGGSSIAAYLNAKNRDVILFEKESYLGGCSSTFTHGKFKYNTGATTFAGYQDDFIVKEMFESIGFTPKLIPTDPTIVVMQNGKITPRFRDFEKFLVTLEQNYPHPKNREFWALVFKINREFYKHNSYHYTNATLLQKILSLSSFIPLGVSFARYMGSAEKFVERFFGGISLEYKEFLSSQILIVAQAPLSEINFLTAALALGYTFNENYYAIGGMSELFNGMTSKIEHVKRESEILSIREQKGYFELETKDKIYLAKKVILNTTVYESAKLFNDKKIKNYFKSYEKLDNHQSSFMLYMTIKSEKKFEHHYQIIQDEHFSHTISKALFVSISDKSDNTLSPLGHYSITTSIHTDVRFWEDKASYKSQKKELEAELLGTIIKNLKIDKAEIVHIFCATPKTFKRYINRSQLGGNAITMKNFVPFLPGNDTKIKGLYSVGDTVYAAQGWPGVMLGVKNLTRILDV